MDSVSDLLRLASTYKLEPMVELVQKKLMDSLDPTNCIKILMVALSDPLLLRLKNSSIQTIVDNLSDIVAGSEWEELTKSQPVVSTEILRDAFK